MGEVCKRNRKTTGHFIYLPFGPVQESALFLTSDWPMPVIFLHEDQHLIISVTILVKHRLSVNRESKVSAVYIHSVGDMGAHTWCKNLWNSWVTWNNYSKIPVTRTLRGNAKRFKLVGNLSYPILSYRGSTEIQRSQWEVNTIEPRKIIARKQRKTSQVFTPMVT